MLSAEALGGHSVWKPYDKLDREIGKVFRALLKIIGHGHSKNHGNPRAAKMIQYFFGWMVPDIQMCKFRNPSSNGRLKILKCLA